MEKIYFSSKNLDLLTEITNTQLQSRLGGGDEVNVHPNDVFETMKRVWENAVTFREGDDAREYIISLNNDVVRTMIQSVVSALSPPSSNSIPKPSSKSRRKKLKVVSSPQQRLQSKPTFTVVRGHVPIAALADESDSSEDQSESDLEDSVAASTSTSNNTQNGTLSMDKIQEIMLDQLRQSPDPPSDDTESLASRPVAVSSKESAVVPSNSSVFIHSNELKISDAKSDYTIDLSSHVGSKWKGFIPKRIRVSQASLPGSDFTISKHQNSIRFFEQEGKELVAHIPIGNYPNGIAHLLETLETQMNAVGSSKYSCSLDPASNKVCISSKPPSNSKVHLFHLNGEGLGELLGFKPKMYTSNLEHISDLPYCQNLILHQTHFVRLYVNQTPVSQFALRQNTLNHFSFVTPFVPFSFGADSSLHLEFKTDSGRYYNFQGQNHSLVLELCFD